MSISLTSIKELFGKKFYIPDYQRGYRWGDRQVKDLLSDIDEFADSIADEPNTSKIYCLQPLVVAENKVEGFFSVIDGQQRLTTIKILLSCLGEKEKYQIEYQTREGSEHFLDTITEEQNDVDWKSNADFFHMYNAKKKIVEWLSGKGEAYKNRISKIIKERVNMVWYESDDPDPISVFTRLNIGRIGLTESELVKALFLSSNNFTSDITAKNQLLTLVEIAGEWDKMEYRLQDDRFWLFFHGTSYNKPTRIDFVLDIARKNYQNTEQSDDGEMYPTFRYFYDSFKNAEDKQKYLTEQWQNISRVYQILEEWYSDEELYHYIGFLCASPQTDEVLFDFISVYLGKKPVRIGKRGSEKIIDTKNDFVRYLKKEIKSRCGRALDLSLEYEGENHPSKTEARPVLLLHNVQTVLNQNASIAREKKYSLPDFVRFPFHLYKKEGWDVEHVRPNSLEEYLGDRKKSARAKYVFVLRQYRDPAVTEMIAKYDRDRSDQAITEETAFITLWNSINGDNANNELSEREKNKIWNYVLLDASTNREYGNSCFAIKRDYVLKKEKGIKPKLTIDRDEINSIDEKEAAFVPVCTRSVFSKAYTDYPDDLKYWTEKDAAYYRMDLEKTLWWYVLDPLSEELCDEKTRDTAFNDYKKETLYEGNYLLSFKEWYNAKKGVRSNG